MKYVYESHYTNVSNTPIHISIWCVLFLLLNTLFVYRVFVFVCIWMPYVSFYKRWKRNKKRFPFSHLFGVEYEREMRCLDWRCRRWRQQKEKRAHNNFACLLLSLSLARSLFFTHHKRTIRNRKHSNSADIVLNFNNWTAWSTQIRLDYVVYSALPFSKP